MSFEGQILKKIIFKLMFLFFSQIWASRDVLKMFLIFGKFEPQCSYKGCSYKKKVYCRRPLMYFIFLDASSYIYEALSVRRSVHRLVHRSIGPSVGWFVRHMSRVCKDINFVLYHAKIRLRWFQKFNKNYKKIILKKFIH